MKQVYLSNILVLLIWAFSFSCIGQGYQGEVVSKDENHKTSTNSYKEHDKVTSSLLDKDGNLWFGTSNEGMYKYDGKLFTHFTEEDGLSDAYINCIVEDDKSIIWIGTKNGLTKYDGETFTNIRIPGIKGNSSNGEWWDPNYIISMLVDTSGDLWIGTLGAGAYNYNGKEFINLSFENDYKQSDSLHNNVIQSITQDADGNIWFCSTSHGGITRYNSGDIKHYKQKDGLLDDMVFSSYQDKSGDMWFGTIQTKYKGLYKLEGETFVGWGKEEGLCDNFVTGFFEDAASNFWVLTGSKMCLFDGDSFQPLPFENAYLSRDIGTIVQDKDGNIWLGGKYGKLWQFKGKELIDYTRKGRK